MIADRARGLPSLGAVDLGPFLPLCLVSDNGHTPRVSSLVNSQAILGFLDFLKIEKGLAALTISAYKTDIRQFAEFLERRKRRQPPKGPAADRRLHGRRSAIKKPETKP